MSSLKDNKKQKTTILIDKNIYQNFKINCKNHKLPVSIVLEVLMERFNDRERELTELIKKHGRIEIAKQKLEQAQGRSYEQTRRET